MTNSPRHAAFRTQAIATFKSAVPLFATIGVKVIGAGSALMLAILIGRYLGAEDAGIYYTMLSIVLLMSFLGTAGLQQVTMREVATSQGASHEIRAIIRRILIVASVPTSVVVLVMLTVGSELAPLWFKQPKLEAYLPWCALAVVATVLFNLFAEALRGYRRVISYSIIMFVAVNAFALLMLIPSYEGWLKIVPAPLDQAVLAYIFACAATLVVAMLSLSQRLWATRGAGGASATLEKNLPTYLDLVKSGWAFIGYGLATQGFQWIAPIILASARSSEEVALYSSALRINMLVGFILVAVATALGPKFASYYRDNEMAAFRQLYKKSLIFSVSCITPLVLVLLVFSEKIMAAFGADFADASGALFILLIGQLVSALFGPAAQVLVSAKRERILQKVSVTNLLFAIPLYVVSSNQYGYIGTAVVTTISVILMKVVLVFPAKNILLSTSENTPS